MPLIIWILRAFLCMCVSLLLLLHCHFKKWISNRALLKGTLSLMATTILKVFIGSNWFNYFHLDKRNKHFWESTMLVLNPIWILDSPGSSLKYKFPEHLSPPPHPVILIHLVSAKDCAVYIIHKIVQSSGTIKRPGSGPRFHSDPAWAQIS